MCESAEWSLRLSFGVPLPPVLSDGLRPGPSSAIMQAPQDAAMVRVGLNLGSPEEEAKVDPMGGRVDGGWAKCFFFFGL